LKDDSSYVPLHQLLQDIHSRGSGVTFDGGYMEVKKNTWFVSLLFSLFLFLLLSAPAQSEERKLTIGTSYKSLLSKPDQSGMLDRIIKIAFQRIGITVDIPFLPAERSIMAANSGIHDGELNRIEGIERLYPNLVRVPESNMDFNFVAFSIKQNFATTDWSTLKSRRVGFIKGWKILEEQLKDHPNIIYANSAEQLFNQLDKEHIDVALYGEKVGRAQVKNMGLTDIKILKPPLATRKMYMYLNKKHKNITVKVAESLREMKRDGSYDRIVEEAISPYLNGATN
jgi:polar amino acid transport system substrate-binding protein